MYNPNNFKTRSELGLDQTSITLDVQNKVAFVKVYKVSQGQCRYIRNRLNTCDKLAQVFTVNLHIETKSWLKLGTKSNYANQISKLLLDCEYPIFDENDYSKPINIKEFIENAKIEVKRQDKINAFLSKLIKGVFSKPRDLSILKGLELDYFRTRDLIHTLDKLDNKAIDFIKQNLILNNSVFSGEHGLKLKQIKIAESLGIKFNPDCQNVKKARINESFLTLGVD